MKMFLRLTLSLLAVLLAAEGMVRHLAPNLPDPAAWPTPETEIKSAQIDVMLERPDVVFVGTSVSEAAIDPDLIDRALGVRSYNAALPFSTPLSMDLWVQEMVLPELHPDVLIIGVHEATIALGVDVLVGPLARSLEYRADPEWWQQSSLMAHRRQLRQPEQTIERTSVLGSGLWTSAGHQTAYYDRSLAVVGVVEPTPAPGTDAEMLLAVEATIQRTKMSGAMPVLLLEPGGCPPVYGRCDVALSVRPQIVQIAEVEDIPVIDGRSVEWPDAFYADPSHFNQQGTQAFSEFIAQALEAIWFERGRS